MTLVELNAKGINAKFSDRGIVQIEAVAEMNEPTYALMMEGSSEIRTGMTVDQVKGFIRRFELWKKSHFDHEYEGNYTTRFGNRVTIVEEYRG